MFTISESIKINSVIWIRSLPEIEKGPSERIVEDLSVEINKDGFYFSIRDVANAAELDDLLGRKLINWVFKLAYA